MSSTLEDQLTEIAKRLKLQVFDLDEGIFGLDSKDDAYGLEVLRVEIDAPTPTSPLGIELTEMASNQDGRGLVLVSGVSGKAADTKLQIGDIITGVLGSSVKIQTAGQNYDTTVEAIQEVRQAEASSKTLTLEINRLVQRASITVKVLDGKTQQETNIEALAGENLRRLLLRKNLKLYDSKTKRFDMPYNTGDCAGEGLCGTCLVKVRHGQELLNPKDSLEELITKKRPANWRASCRTVVGYDNQKGELTIVTHPQSDYADELDRGVQQL
jgi:ferredoxin